MVYSKFWFVNHEALIFASMASWLWCRWFCIRAIVVFSSVVGIGPSPLFFRGNTWLSNLCHRSTKQWFHFWLAKKRLHDWAIRRTFVSWLRCADIVFQAQVHWCWVLVHISLTFSMVHDLPEQPMEETRPSQMPMTSSEHPPDKLFFLQFFFCTKCQMWLNGPLQWEDHLRNKKHNKKTWAHMV